MLLGIPYLIALLILIVPFLVVGSVTLIAEACGADLFTRSVPAPRPSRPAMRWAVA